LLSPDLVYTAPLQTGWEKIRKGKKKKKEKRKTIKGKKELSFH
jgi:hypothetical protein